MSFAEFEAILDEAAKSFGSEKEEEIFMGEVYVLMEQFEKSNRSITLPQAISFAKEFEVMQKRRKSDVDSTMLNIAAMGQPLSRAERRFMERNKSNGRSATKPKKKRRK